MSPDADHELVGYGNEIDPADYPWIEDALAGVPSSPDTDGPSPETYLSWKPDLMIANGNLGDYWAPAAAVGRLLQLPETDWRATTTLLGRIFDEPDIAEKVIADTDAMIADARLDEPITAAVLSPYQENGTVGTQVLGAELPNFLADPLVAEIPVVKAGNVTRLTTVQSHAGVPVNPLTVPVLIEALKPLLDP